MVNFNESEINSHTVTKKKASPLPEFLQPILAVKTNDIRNDKKCLVKESSSSESEEIETPLVDQSIHSESSDEEIATPLAISQKQKEETIEDTKASHNFKSLQCTFNSNCVKYYSKSYYYLFKSNKSQTKQYQELKEVIQAYHDADKNKNKQDQRNRNDRYHYYHIYFL